VVSTGRYLGIIVDSKPVFGGHAQEAGIRQAFALYAKPAAHLKWDREALRGLTYN